MNTRPLAIRLLRLTAGIVLLLCAGNLRAATPASQNFNDTNQAAGPGISSRFIGDWQFRLLDANGDDDSGGYDFVDVIDDTYTNTTVLASGSDQALSLIGTLNIAVAAQIRSTNSSPFRLVSFAIDGDDLTYLVTGYSAGLPVPGAVQNFYAPYQVETIVAPTNSAFQNIEEFRISRQDGAADVWMYIDDITVANPVASSASPVIANLNGDSAIFIEGGSAARFDTLTAATVTDSDSPDFHGGAIVVGIVGGRIPPQDVLLVAHQGNGSGQVGVSGSNVTYAGTVVGSFSGGSSYDDFLIALNTNASKTAARDILRRLAYTNTSTGVPITSTRSISIRLYDGDGGYASVTAGVSVQLNNNPPAITTTGSTNVFQEGINEPSLSIVVDSGVIISDVDSATLTNTTISITRNFNSAQDQLLFTNVPNAMGNISSSYNTNSGVLTLTSVGATANIAEWRAALRTVAYLNNSEAPTLGQRTVTFILNDGSDVSEPGARAINISDYNDSPVNTTPGGTLLALINSPITFLAGTSTALSVADPDAGNAAIQVAINVSTGSVTLARIDGLSFIVGTGTDDEHVGVTGNLTNINAALDGLYYTPPVGFFGPATLTIYTSDFGASGTGGHQSDTDVLQIFIAPSYASALSVTATNIDGTYTIGQSIGIAVQFDQPVVVDNSAGTPTLELNAGVTNRHPAPYVTGSGTDTLLFLYTVLAGHHTARLDYASSDALVLSGGTITNAFGAPANLALPPPGDAGSLGTNRQISVDGILPTVQSVILWGQSPTAETNVLFHVTFSEPIAGIDLSDFTLATSGTATGTLHSIAQIGIFPERFAVTVHGVDGDGTLRLDLNESGSGITDLAGQAIVGGFTNGAVCTIDNSNPQPPVFTGISEDTGIDGDFVTADARLVLRGTGQPNTAVHIFLEGYGQFSDGDVNETGQWTRDITDVEIPDGTNVFTAEVIESAGNTSALSSPFIVIVNRSLRLRLLSTPSVFTLKKSFVKVDAFATLEPGERAHFGGGQLVVSVNTNRTAADQLSIYNDTNGGPGLRLSGTNVLWGDLLIAESSRVLPTTSNSVTFTFTTNATPSAVQALAREIAFSSTHASMLPRTVHFALTDGFGTAAPDAFKSVLINKAPALAGVTNRFANSIGTFSGLVLRTNDIVASEAGSFQLKITPRLAFSGSLLIAGRKTAFSGQFNTNGHASMLTSGNKWGIDLALATEASIVRGRVTAYVGGGWTSDLLGHLTAVGTTNFNTARAGSYTLSLPPSFDPELGSGWATLTVDRLGVTKLKGTLADGQAWTASSLLGTNGHWPLAAALDRRQGVILGWLVFSNTTPVVIGGALTWLKPAAAPFVTNGVAAELDVNGSRYTAPVGTNTILASTNNHLVLRQGNLASLLASQVHISGGGKFLGSSGSISNLTMSINTRAGSFSGTFKHPAGSRTTKYSGVLLQPNSQGSGFFLGTNRGGFLLVNPAD